MSFSDTIFLFFLALILFGPKRLPEMARKAGKILADLRRASNEFRSQIETEIAHLEVAQQKPTVLPPASAPQGTVASLSVNPAVSESIPHSPEATATLATPPPEPLATTSNLSLAANDSSTSAPANSLNSESAAENIPASQESHA